jgi:polysaccharide biosynthesis transport protein
MWGSFRVESQTAKQASETKSLSLNDYLEVFFIRRRLFLICVVITPLVALIVSFLIPKVYQSSTKIWAKEQRTGDPFRIEDTRLSFLKDQQELIQSNVVVSRVLESLPMEAMETLSKKPWNELAEEKRTILVEQLKKSVEVEIDPGAVEGGSSFIVIKVKAGIASLAARLANLFAKKYIEFYYELKTKAAHDSYKFLETQVGQVAQFLEDSESKLRDFEIKLGPRLIPLIELTKQGTSASFTESYRFIGSYDLYVADYAEKAKALTLFEDLRRETGGKFVPADTSSKNLSLIHARDSLDNLRLKLTNIRQRRTERFDDVGMLQNEVQYAEQMFKGQAREDFESRSAENKASKEKLAFMEKRVQEIEKNLVEIAGNRVTYEKLRRDVDNQSAIFKKVSEELENARIAAELSVYKTANINIIDKALPPFKALRPNKVLNLILGVFGGIIIGVGLVMISAYLDETIKRPEQVTQYLGLDVLGSILTYGKNNKEDRLAWIFGSLRHRR